MSKKTLYFFAFLASFAANAQKKPLTHDVYDSWKSIENTQISSNGAWASYELNPQDGDGKLLFYGLQKSKIDSIARGKDARFTFDDAFSVFKIVPVKDSVRFAKKAKKKKEEMPTDALGIYNLTENSLTKISSVLSFKIPEKQGTWLAYQLTPKAPAKAPKDTSGKATPKVKIKKESEINGSRLVLRNLPSKTQTNFEYVKEYEFPKYGKYLAFATTGNDSTLKAGVYVYDLEKASLLPVIQSVGNYSNLSFSEDGSQLAFVADLDTNQKTLLKNPQLMYWKLGAKNATVVADSSQKVYKNWLVSANYKPVFSKDGKKLFFGTNPRPLLKDTTKLEDELVKLDVWNWQDTKLMTQQLVQLKTDLKKSYLAVYQINTQKTTQLANAEIPETKIVSNGDADYVVAMSALPYSNQHWDWSGAADIYTLSTKDGSSTKIATDTKIGSDNAFASPTGKYVYWYSKADTAWFAYEVKSNKTIQLTRDKNFSDIAEDDHPDYPSAYGLAAWTKNDEKVLIYDRYDLWLIDPAKPTELQNITKGKDQNRSFRYVKLDAEEKNIDLEKPILLRFFDEKTKVSGYAHYVDKSVGELLRDDFKFSSAVWKAKKSTGILFTKESFKKFPDLQYSPNGDFKNIQQISEANPQQKNYNWGSVEMVSWKSLDGIALDGLLYKPEDFDASKQYPMITYYYEKLSDNIHDYRNPQPERASVNYSYYTSNGYLIFVPDIVYKIGYPGQSAYNCVMPGIMKLLEKNYVNPKKLGLQGHSWGGYQTAYLITQTNMFAAAEAGAPVSNMTSAYGGIRWETGLSRMAQYEHNQTRLGANLWEKPMLYLENSPLFYLPKVQTPLLILHNDADGAVPWQQGIELFLGLKRLNKPAWLLNYNDEKHGLTIRKNKVDWTIRMSQFFAHYLKDAPMPVWMSKGISATDKTLEYGFGN